MYVYCFIPLLVHICCDYALFNHWLMLICAGYDCDVAICGTTLHDFYDGLLVFSFIHFKTILEYSFQKLLAFH